MYYEDVRGKYKLSGTASSFIGEHFLYIPVCFSIRRASFGDIVFPSVDLVEKRDKTNNKVIPDAN